MAHAGGGVGGRCKRLDDDQRRHAVEIDRSRQRTAKEICAFIAYVEKFAEASGMATPASAGPFVAASRSDVRSLIVDVLA